MSLESVGKLVEEHSAASSPAQQKAEKIRAEREIVRSMFTSLMIGMAILGLGVFLLVVNKTINLGAFVSLLTSFLILGGTGYAAYAGSKWHSQRRVIGRREIGGTTRPRHG